MNNDNLSTSKIKKDKILHALINSKDIKEAAKTANVSRKTIYSYLKNRDFIEAYNNLNRIQMREIIEKITTGAIISADYLISSIKDNSVPINTKVQLCSRFLMLYAKFIAIEENMNTSAIKESEKLHFDISSLFKNI